MKQLFRFGPLCGLLAIALLPLFLSPARAQGKVEPLISPEEMLSVDQIRPGMKGVGRSVFEGTKIEPFNVTVVGVLRKIDFGGDMILVRIEDGAPVTSGAGVSAGMSGSPIYVDGKLIGALAFAWPFAKQPLAGVTPIAQMLENYRPGSVPASPSVAQAGSLQPEGGPLKLDGQLFARATVVPDRGLIPAGAHGTLYLTPVATPVMVSGMGRAGLEELKRRFSRFPAVFAPGPGAVNLPASEKPKLEPGSAIGVQLLGGDVDATAIGTVTYVKGNVVLGFGHPMFGLGTLDMPMTTAYVHGVIPSQEVSFKLGAPVETVGRLSQDRNWAIGGEVGEIPRSVEAEFVISDKDRGVKRDYRVRSAVHRDLTATLLYSTLMNAVGSVSPPNSGTTRGTVEVWAKGMPVIRRENVFATGERRSAIEQLFGDPFAGMPLVELLQILDTLENNTFGAVPVERLKVTVEVSEARRTAAVERAYADRKRVKPGEKVKIGVVIRPTNGEKETREFELTIPPNIPGGRLLIGVAGGGAADRIRQFMQITRPPAKTLTQLVSQISDREQNNELVIELAQPVVGVSVAGRELPNLPNVVVEVLTSANPSGIRMIRSHSLQRHPTEWVLSGGQLLALQVDADEKDKSGPALAAGGTGLGGFSSLLDLFRVGAGAEFGGDIAGDPTGDETMAARLRALARYLAGEPKLPTDPQLPTFEELQRLLDATGAEPGAPSGGTSGVKTKGLGRGPGVWRFGAASDFQGGRLEGVLVSSRGGLALAPQATPLLTSPERFFWAQAADSSGSVYVAGWLDGSIERIGPDGKTATVFEGKEEIAITALTCGADGTLFAAAEPSGSIYRIDPSGQARVLCRLAGQRVWALKQVGSSLYAGTGSEGRVYRISEAGEAQVAFTAPDRHVLSLAADGERLYCATYPRGKVFRLEGGKVEPVYELPNLTATALAVDKHHNLYLGTSPRATVVKISPSGDASTLFSSTTEKHVFSLLLGDQGEVYAGVGPQARVYRIDPDKTLSTLWEPQAAYVLSLSRDASGSLFATTAGPTQIVRLTPRTAGRGTFTSAVLNAGNVARWGAVRWTAPGGEVRVQTRTGNTAYPDATWSGWSDPYAQAGGQPIASPAGQYLQYRVSLEGREGSASPALRSLELFYRARNRAPVITVRRPGSGDWVAGARAIQWTSKDPDGDRLRYDLFYAPEGSDKWVKIGSQVAKPEAEEETEEESGETSALPPPVQLGKAAAPRARVRSASAVRPARGPRPVSAKPVPVQSGVPVLPDATTEASGSVLPGAEAETGLFAAEDTGGGGTFSWNTRGVPDGRYRIKVVASDSLTSPDEPATAEAVSEVFRLDNSAPEIRLKTAARKGPAPPLEVSLVEKTSYVASAEYRVGSGEWIAVAAADGIFDSPEETIRIDPARLPAGRHVLFIRARDVAGNQSWVKTPYVKK